MKLPLLTVLFWTGCFGVMTAVGQVPVDIEPIQAPFEMPVLERPSFPGRTLSITSTGAKPSVLCTQAIQKAIDKLAAKGGGTVVIPQGEWLTGRLILRSNINLRLEEGAELHFSGEIKDYLPVVRTRNEGVDILSLGAMIYACEAENIALTGSGKLVSPDTGCELYLRQEGGVEETLEGVPLEQRVFDGADQTKIFLPVFFGPVDCKNILVEGVSFEQSVFWNIAPTYCKNIIIRNICVKSYGHGRTDGIDIDSSVNALIEYVDLDCGDDCIALKAGRGNDGTDRNRPTENVVIRHCTLKRSVGGVAIGSETAGKIRNVYAYDCMMENPQTAFLIKTRRPRGGGGENLYFEQIHIRSCKTVVSIDMLGSARFVGDWAERFPARPVGKLTPSFRDISFKGIVVDSCSVLMKAIGLPESPIENVTLQDIQSPNGQMRLQDIGRITFQ
ncbi:MAG: glycoside hydrolase family 28 protein [Porphyromonadaceae bacterium]|nr:glycoside hydrolase family 28 protein [Porphyromonadaceae bacterium]